MISVRVLTPPGRAAIAVVEVAGPEAASIVDRWFMAVNGKAASEQPVNAIRFGTWIAARDGQPDETVPGEELIVVRTAAERIEVHCHGGVAAVAAVRAALLTHGAVEISETSLLEDARVALSLATTERVAGVLLDQAGGALDATLLDIVQLINAGQTEAACQRVTALLQRERLGRRLTTPWRVVLAGPPNVGKSSLINALVGYDRVLVYDQPGTTRDVVTAATAVGGWPVTFADTAGVRDTTDPLEAAGVQLTRQTLGTADIVVVVREAATLDAAELTATRDRMLNDAPEDAVTVDVASKVDLLPTDVVMPDGIIATNAPAGVGIDTLLTAIEQAMAVSVPPVGTAVPFRPEHFDALRATLALLKSGAASEATASLQALLAGAKP